MGEPLGGEGPQSGRAVGALAARGAAWMFGLNMSLRLLGLVRTAIIARLLAPNDLGLFGIALLAQSIIEVFTMMGVNSALVRHPDDIEPYLDTAWVIAVFRALGVAVLMVAVAPLVAAFFHEPGAAELTRVLALTAVLGGFLNPVATISLRRQLRFGRMYVYLLVPSLADIGVSIGVAFAYRTAMALILGLIARAAVQLVLGFVLVPFKPRMRYDRARARELLSYGKWITWSTILRFVYGNGDDIVVGRLLGASSLGIYQMGYKYSNMPNTEITRVLQTVALPVYAKLQHDAALLRKAFVEALATTSLLSLGLAGYIWVIAPDFVRLILGSKWAGVVPVMRLLAVWGAVESVSEVPIALFEAVGRPRLETSRLLTKTVLLAALIYPLLRWWGLNGVCVAVLVSSVPALVWALVNASHVSAASWRQITLALAVPVAAAAAAMGAAVLVGLVLSTGNWPSFGVLTCLCVAIYAVVLLIARAFGYRVFEQSILRLRSGLAREA